MSLSNLIDFFLHLDRYLFEMIVDYGWWINLILFVIIFVETGLVVMPFLPGDSLLFAVGTFCAGIQNEAGQTAELSLAVSLGVLISAAILGDTANYFIGKEFGHKILGLTIRGKRVVKPEHIDKTSKFYEEYGAKTIIIARFVPIVRTFAPFVAGIGSMHYGRFVRYNIIGGLMWVTGLILLGYFFGNLGFVRKNFELVIFGIIALSLLPMLVELVRARFARRSRA